MIEFEPPTGRVAVMPFIYPPAHPKILQSFEIHRCSSVHYPDLLHIGVYSKLENLKFFALLLNKYTSFSYFINLFKVFNMCR